MARAGLNRLGQAHVGTPLDPAEWLPAPGQGAIAIECRADDAATHALLAAIDHAPSHAALKAERALLAALGGNCHSAVAVLTQAEGEVLHLKAALFSPDGTERVDGEARVTPGDHKAVAAFAASLLARASPAVTRHFTGAA